MRLRAAKPADVELQPWFAAGAVALLQSATPAPFPSSAPTPPACARPNVVAITLRSEEPDTPEIAQRNGIAGTVQVIVSLDEESRVTNARLMSSPLAVLNAAALNAARHSHFQTRVRNCRPERGDFIYLVEFADFWDAVRRDEPVKRRKTVLVVGNGHRPIAATSKSVRIEFATHADSRQTAAMQSAEKARAFAGRVKRWPVTTAYSDLFEEPIAGVPGSTAYVGFEVHAAPSLPVNELFDAARSAGANTATIRYDAGGRYEAALEAFRLAMNDAAKRAAALAAAQGKRLGDPIKIEPAVAPESPDVVPLRVSGPIHEPPPRPVNVDVEVRVTYVLRD